MEGGQFVFQSQLSKLSILQLCFVLRCVVTQEEEEEEENVLSHITTPRVWK